MADAWPDSEPDRLKKHFPEWTAWFESPAVDGSEVEKGLYEIASLQQR